MTRNDILAEIHKRGTELLKPDRSGKGFICPICGSGTGKNGTGITTKDGIHYTCWVGCFKNVDILDVIGMKYGLEDFNAKLDKTAELLGIVTDSAASIDRRPKKKNELTPLPKPKQKREDSSLPDYSAYLKKAASRLEQTDYLSQRGIRTETARRFDVGFDPAWTHPSAKGKRVFPSPRLIIPTGKDGHSYTARDTTGRSSRRYINVGHTEPFFALMSDEPDVIFIVEGEIDALSIAEAGQSAIAIGGTSNVRRIISEIESGKYDSVFVPALDNDEAGRNASKTLCEGLDRLGVKLYVAELFDAQKDANGALTASREAFIKKISETAAEAVSVIENQEYSERKKEHLSASAGAHLHEFVNGIFDIDTPCVSTGFDSLDDILDGGLYEGLYIVGAISSLGKTTFVMQMADSIAASDHDVLIFSLEMSRNELIAKSISRHTFIRILEYGGEHRYAKTARGITSKARYRDYCDAEKKLIADALDDYTRYADNVYIFEGVGDYGTERIRQTVEDHIRYTGRTPVVVVDYLQIIAPAEPRASDKQNTDRAVLDLKRMSRDLKIPVLAVSSLNRGGYNTKAAMETFKESGSIEYSSDVLFGLQLKGVGDDNFDVNAAKRQEPREIELVVLKNRYGKTGEIAEFRYSAMFNYFEEAGVD